MRSAVWTVALVMLQACPQVAPAPEDAGGGGGAGGGATTGGGTGGGGSSPTLETQAPPSVHAGEGLNVQCELLGASAATIVNVTPGDGLRVDGGLIVPTRAGTIEVACAAPTLGLVDPTPARVQVEPGPIAMTSITVSSQSLVAGNAFGVACAVTDAFGNAVSDAGSPALSADPGPLVGPGDGGATLTVAGTHSLRCELSAADAGQVTVTVGPALPSAVMLERLPDLMTYDAGTVGVRARVADRFGNDVPAATVSRTIAVVSGPGVPRLESDGGLFFPMDGLYRVTVSVDPPTEADASVAGAVDFLVNGEAPALRCESPVDLAQLTFAPDASLELAGLVDDGNGVASVTANGLPATLDGGAWRAGLTTRFGVNSVELVATDTEGRAARGLCTFVAGDRWVGEDAGLDDTIALQLLPAAVRDTSAAVDSLSDVTTAFVRSGSFTGALASELDAGLGGLNPLKALSCDVEVCGPPCVCFSQSSVTHQGVVVSGTPLSLLTILDGGVAASVALTLVESVQLGGTESASGTATFSATARAEYDLRLLNGRPRVSYRPNTTTVTLQNTQLTITASSSGQAAVANAVNAAPVRAVITTAIRTRLESQLVVVLDELLGSVQLPVPGTFGVPRLSQAGALSFTFATGVSSVSVTPERLVLGMSSRTTPNAAGHARPNLGVLVVDGPRPLALASTSPASGLVHQAARAQRLTALWRAGWFDGALAAGSLPAFPSFAGSLTALLPPVTTNAPTGHAFVLQLGGVSLAVTDPSLPSGLVVRFDAEATVPMTLGVGPSGRDLVPGSVTVDALVLQPVSNHVLSPAEEAAVRERVTALMALIAARVFADAEPALALPQLILPSAASGWGLPAGQPFRVQSPAVSSQGAWSVFSGPLGLQ